VIQIEMSGSSFGEYSGWSVGFLELGGLAPRGESPGLVAEVEAIEAAIKRRYGGMSRRALAGTEAAGPYAEHFGRHGRAYPVLLQAEAIASRGRKLAMADSLVQGMFAAELEGMLLTAGHDLDAFREPVELGLASGTETLPTLGGAAKAIPAGDLVMRDAEGVAASLLLGPDARTSIGPATERALFVVYAPPGCPRERMAGHLEKLESLAALACPGLARRGARTVTL